MEDGRHYQLSAVAYRIFKDHGINPDGESTPTISKTYQLRCFKVQKDLILEYYPNMSMEDQARALRTVREIDDRVRLLEL